MKLSRLPFSILTCALAFLLMGSFNPALAAAKAPPKPVVVDTRKLVKSIDLKESTIVIEFMRDKTMHTYTIDDLTNLKVDNVPSSKIADIKVGMQVTDYMERNAHTLDSVTIDDAQPPPSN